MRKHIPIIALALLLVLPSMASAVYLDSVTGTADCNGWSADVEITFRSGARLVRLEYIVALTDESGTEIDRMEYASEVDIPAQSTMIYSFGEPWSIILPDGPYTMTCDVTLYDIYPDGQNRFTDSVSVGFECGDGSVGGEDPQVTGFCPKGKGYWKNHTRDWPVMTLDLGGDSLDQAALLNVLNSPTRGDATITLACALITAKLNQAAGAGDPETDVMDAADAFLAEHPVFSNPGKADRKTAHSFLAELGEYNSGDCDEGDDPTGENLASDLGLSRNAAPSNGYDKAAAIEEMSMGSVKALFR